MESEYDLETMCYLPCLTFHLFYTNYSEGEVYVRVTEDINKVREYFGPVIMYGINTITRAGFVITMMYIVIGI